MIWSNKMKRHFCLYKQLSLKSNYMKTKKAFDLISILIKIVINCCAFKLNKNMIKSTIQNFKLKEIKLYFLMHSHG